MDYPVTLRAQVFSRWYQATTLLERRSLFVWRENPLAVGEERLTRARRFLEHWKKQTAFPDPDLFSQRLASDGLDEQELLRLLAEPPENLVLPEAAAPTFQWMQQLERVLAFLDGDVGPQAGTEQEQPALTLLDVFRPLIESGGADLKAGLRRLTGASSPPPFTADAAFDLLRENLLPRLRLVALRSLVLEMHIARLEQRLSGETPQERFTNFLRHLCQPEHLRAFLEEYPVLARALLATIQQWAGAGLELFQRLSADWDEIRAAFAGDYPAGVGELVAVQMGAGDTHREGRSVAFLRFSSGFQVVYKPRALALDRHFQGLLGWLNARGITHPLRAMALLDRGAYGWCEFIQARDCATEEEIQRFYTRQGYYLALMYVLDASDLHYENLLAVGEYPYLIDLEALFHPCFDERDAGPAAPLSIYSTVLKTGLLPHRTQLEAGGEGIDLSGLGGQEGQLTPRPIFVWKERETDNMCLERERWAIAGEKNRPRLRGQEVDVLAYQSVILAGFAEAYRLIAGHRTEWLTRLLPPFERDEVRVLLRGTRIYGFLLFESYHPQRLQDALERDILFDQLWKGIPSQPYLSRAIAAERRDLEEGNIPLFTTRPASADIFTSRGERIADFCAEPGMESVKRRVQQMGEEDLTRQQWVIQAALTSLVMGEERMPQLSLSATREGTVAPEQLLQAACAVGERLEALAFQSGQGANWLGVNQEQEVEGKAIWGVQALSPVKLYDGIPGVVLFLSYLGAVSGNAKYTTLARSALRTIEETVELVLHPTSSLQEQARESLTLGAFDGLGSLIYLFVHLGRLWREPSYLILAEALARLLQGFIARDERLDIITGSAGGLASLLNLYQAVPEPRTLAIAVRCGERLLAYARQMSEGLGWETFEPGCAPAGFSHGAAGIALSLLRLASATGEERFRRAALQSMAYERSLFDSERGNWPRELKRGEKDFPVFWCHGAPGIGLARLASLEHVEDQALRQDIELALETTLGQGFGRSQSLCHGDLGSLETVLVAARTLNHPACCEALPRLTAMVFHGIQEHGRVTGVPLGVETPGLMTGLAGIGYELLRLAKPDRVPSVLTLAPPPA